MAAASPTDSVAPRWGVWFSSALSTLLPAHNHDCPELNVVMSGSMKYRLETGPELYARAGQIIVLPAGTAHELISSSEDVALWVMELNGVVGLPWLEQPQVVTPEAWWRKSLVMATRRLWLRPGAAEAGGLQQQLLELLLSFRTGSDHRPLPPLHPAVQRAKRVCETAVAEELDVSALARQSGISASRLAHIFTQQLGLTPVQYRNFARVQHFIRTYNGDEGNLLRAALRAGFGSYAQFHRVFRQICGEPPATHVQWLWRSGEVDARLTLGGAISEAPAATAE